MQKPIHCIWFFYSKFVVLGLAFFSLLGCAPKPLLITPPDVVPLVEQRNASVAIIYDQALVDHSCTTNHYGVYAWIIDLGGPSMVTFNVVWEQLFSEYTVQGAPIDEAVNEPTIKVYLEEFSYCKAPGGYNFDRHDFLARFRFEFFLNEDQEPTVIDILGDGHKEKYQYSFKKDLFESKTSAQQYLEFASESMLRDAAAKLILELHTNPELIHWMDKLEAR